MGSFSFQDKEFERNKKEILRRMTAANSNLAVPNNKLDAGNGQRRYNDNRKYAWEYEIEEYRKKKIRDRFYKIGALAGVLSLIITLVDKFTPIKDLTYTAFNYIFK
ncbi:hypothetical protein R9X47_24590 [Wukongibacter baidiensis]|uniref:hypothetical protein n=1 Tax=Wukongibacter baidiensis TaxID=1723361 RepID=UPI003D7F8A7C